MWFSFYKEWSRKNRKNIFVEVERHLLKNNAQHTKNIPKLPIFRALKKKIFLFWTNRIKLLRQFLVVLTSTIYANEMLISVIVT